MLLQHSTNLTNALFSSSSSQLENNVLWSFSSARKKKTFVCMQVSFIMLHSGKKRGGIPLMHQGLCCAPLSVSHRGPWAYFRAWGLVVHLFIAVCFWPEWLRFTRASSQLARALHYCCSCSHRGMSKAWVNAFGQNWWFHGSQPSQ